MTSAPPAPIPAEYADLLVKPAIAHVATLMPDGSPQVTPVWIMREGDLLVINSARGRLKDKNLRRDGRIGIEISDPANSGRYLSVRGRVIEITEADGDAIIDALSLKYTGNPSYKWRSADEIRVTYRIRPERVTGSE